MYVHLYAQNNVLWVKQKRLPVAIVVVFQFLPVHDYDSFNEYLASQVPQARGRTWGGLGHTYYGGGGSRPGRDAGPASPKKNEHPSKVKTKNHHQKPTDALKTVAHQDGCA